MCDTELTIFTVYKGKMAVLSVSALQSGHPHSYPLEPSHPPILKLRGH